MLLWTVLIVGTVGALVFWEVVIPHLLRQHRNPGQVELWKEDTDAIFLDDELGLDGTKLQSSQVVEPVANPAETPPEVSRHSKPEAVRHYLRKKGRSSLPWMWAVMCLQIRDTKIRVWMPVLGLITMLVLFAGGWTIQPNSLPFVPERIDREVPVWLIVVGVPVGLLFLKKIGEEWLEQTDPKKRRDDR